MKSGVRQVLFFLIVVGVAFVAYQYMIKPANASLAKERIRVQQKAEKLAEFEDATAATEELNKQVEELRLAMEFCESKLPPTSQIYKVLEQVTLIAQKQGLKPKTIKTMDKTNNNGYIEQPLKMELEGNFSSFYSFLLELENLPRIMKIRELKLKKIDDSEQGQITTSFIVSIFFRDSDG